ncbi:MAG TPA: hypothetical protein PLC24_12085 [Myxococcota bacterium]|nr:hypothetical protein [Myxococcota bacterium]
MTTSGRKGFKPVPISPDDVQSGFCCGVVVDAKDESSEQFYGHYGFVTLGAGTWPGRMFLSIDTLKAAASSKH